MAETVIEWAGVCNVQNLTGLNQDRLRPDVKIGNEPDLKIKSILDRTGKDWI